MQSVVFGEKHDEKLEVVVHGYERAITGEYYDDNWLRAEVIIHCGAFCGTFHAEFLTREFESFQEQLITLYKTLRGEAQFRSNEGQLLLVLDGDGLGHIQLKGKALDQFGIGNCLSFSFCIDQTQLNSSLQSLRAMLTSYPVRN